MLVGFFIINSNMEELVNLNNQQLQIGELPELEIVSLDRIVFHEDPDEERSSSLIIYLSKDGRLKNPPMVAYYEDNAHYILLDGANRMTALKKLGIRDVVVQKVDLFDEKLLFLHWHHAVEKFTKDQFLEKLKTINELSISLDTSGILDMNNDPDLLCQIQFADMEIYRISANCDLFKKVDLLKKITKIYSGFANMDRVSYTNLMHLKTNYPDFCAVVCFKKFSKKELVQIVKNNYKLPSGITRIILPKRALRLNVPLDILRFEAPVDEKNHWLQERIKLQVKEKSIRFYYEPTFLFDE